MADRANPKTLWRPLRGNELRAAFPLRQSGANLRQISRYFPQANAKARGRPGGTPFRSGGARRRSRAGPPSEILGGSGSRHLFRRIDAIRRSGPPVSRFLRGFAEFRPINRQAFPCEIREIPDGEIGANPQARAAGGVRSER